MSDHGSFRLPGLLVLTLMIVAASAVSAKSKRPSDIRPAPRESLSVDFLLGNETLKSPLSTQVFIPPAAAQPPAQPFDGLLTLDANAAHNSIEALVDTYHVAGDKNLRLTTLPPFSFEYVSDGSVLIPVQREPQRSKHPYWEIILEPGRVWTDSADEGWSRAALPFALKEKNQNCTHNGLMTFLYQQDSSISRVAWQITNETCLYLKVNLWGTVGAEYLPRPVASTRALVADYRREVGNRLPVKPFSALEVDYPGLDQGAFQPPGIDDASVYGLVLNGVHYRSECPTRYGPYPFCDVLDLPSYSLAKSLFAGLAYLVLSKRWPEFKATSIAALIPECALPDKRWDDVTPAHLLNMTTGNYKSGRFNADEDTSTGAFFLAESNQDKLKFSCEAWPHKVPAGTQWVYHTTDTYLLGVAMNAFLKQKLGAGADIHRDILYPQLLKPLNLSPVMQWTQRTYDDTSQAFSAFGLLLHSDDLVRISLNLHADGAISNTLSGPDFDTALFRDGSPWQTPPDTQGVAYSNGFWGVDASRWIACSTAIWVPFMSGFGGIAVALLPNGGLYYFFSDSNQHIFRKAVVEADKALKYCKE